MVQFKDYNVKSILALIIIVFGMSALIFVHLEQIVIGALIGFISSPLQYFFGDSKSASERNDTKTK